MGGAALQEGRHFIGIEIIPMNSERDTSLVDVTADLRDDRRLANRSDITHESTLYG